MSLFWSQWYGDFWNEDCVNFLVSDWKIELLRCAMAAAHGGYEVNPSKEKAKLVAAVDASIKNGIYVIIDNIIL